MGVLRGGSAARPGCWQSPLSAPVGRGGEERGAFAWTRLTIARDGDSGSGDGSVSGRGSWLSEVFCRLFCKPGSLDTAGCRLQWIVHGCIPLRSGGLVCSCSNAGIYCNSPGWGCARVLAPPGCFPAGPCGRAAAGEAGQLARGSGEMTRVLLCGGRKSHGTCGRVYAVLSGMQAGDLPCVRPGAAAESQCPRREGSLGAPSLGVSRRQAFPKHCAPAADHMSPGNMSMHLLMGGDRRGPTGAGSVADN
jgi:hypothetical protein